MDLSSSPLPEATPAAVFRQALRWAFVPAPGLVIHCRHLDFQDLLVCGVIPLPVLEQFKALMEGDGGTSLKALLEHEDRREITLTVARRYAEAVAISPRISQTRTDDPTVLCVDPADSDLTQTALVLLLNQGVSRRLGVDVARLGIFRGPQPTPASPAAADGGTVPDAAEPLATPGHAGNAGDGPQPTGDAAAESRHGDVPVGS